MKKILLISATLLLVGILLSGCHTTPKDSPDKPIDPSPDVWDGSIAECFAAGSGTEADPYLIATGAQLAYLAKSVNEGNAYSGKVIALAADIDLNDREWTPIGTGDHPFEGTFDGKEHTVSNLSVTKRAEYQYLYAEERFCTVCVSGLFGVCRNVTIQNLSLSKAILSIPEKEPYLAEIYAGTLAGQIFADTSCSVSNVSVFEALIHSVRSESNIAIGGIIGGVIGKGSDPVSCTLNRLQCFASVSRQYAWGSPEWNNVGGIIGQAGGATLRFDCKNFRSDLTLECPEYEEPAAGAFGFLGGKQVTLENGFGVVRIFPTYGFPQTIHAIIGGKDVLWGSTVQCKNLFGRVMPKDENSLTVDPEKDTASPAWQEEQEKRFLSLYSIGAREDSGSNFTEQNCAACQSLPENHGLDPAIWDLTDLANPRLKFNGQTLPIRIVSPVTDFVYQPNNEGSGILITKYIGTDKTVVIPAEIEGFPVIAICGYENDAGKLMGAFQGSAIHSVVIPDSVRAIYQHSFSDCQYLNQVVFGSSSELSVISAAFENCISLEKIDFSATKLTRIESYTFYGCTNLKECNFCNTITYIGERAFYNCTSIQELKLPNELETIENEAFYNCSSLQRLTIPKTLSVVNGYNHFMNCTSLNDVRFEDGIKICMWGYGFFGNCSSLTELTIPASIEKMDASLFILPNLEKIVFLGNRPQMETVDFNEFKSGTTIFYNPSTSGWDPWPWNDPCTHVAIR